MGSLNPRASLDDWEGGEKGRGVREVGVIFKFAVLWYWL